ncbi:MAG: hypothetical protein V9G63_06825 [Candidatus Competibacter sp.]
MDSKPATDLVRERLLKAALDCFLADMRPDLASTTFDLQMFVGTRGRERTLAQ